MKRCGCGAEISPKNTSGLCRSCGTQKAHGDRAFTAADDALLREQTKGFYRTRDIQERFFPNRTLSSVKARIEVLRERARSTDAAIVATIRASRRLLERQLATGQVASVPRMIEWHQRHGESIAA